MRFLLDHDVPVDVIRFLEREGHESKRTIEVLGGTASDPDILKYAAVHEMVVITCNRDHFLRIAQTGPHKGLIVLIRRRSRQAELAHLLALIRRAGESGISGNINFA